MAIIIDSDKGITGELEDRVALECPYCGVYANMQPQSVPDASALLRDQPKHVGLVYKCDACNAPVFLRFAVRQYHDTSIELYRNFVELERPKERFSFSYLPQDTEVLFREALACYSANSFNAFASMCRRAAVSVRLRRASRILTAIQRGTAEQTDNGNSRPELRRHPVQHT